MIWHTNLLAVVFALLFNMMTEELEITKFEKFNLIKEIKCQQGEIHGISIYSIKLAKLSKKLVNGIHLFNQ